MTNKKDLSTQLVNWITTLLPAMQLAYQRAHPFKSHLPFFVDRAFDIGLTSLLAKMRIILHHPTYSDAQKVNEIIDVLLAKLPEHPSALNNIKLHHGKRIVAFVSIKLWQHLSDNIQLLAAERIIIGSGRKKFSRYVHLFDNNLYPHLVAMLNKPFEPVLKTLPGLR